MYYTHIITPMCPIILVGDEHWITHLHLDTGAWKRMFHIDVTWIKNDIFFAEIKQQIFEYFNAQRKSFDIKLNPSGTPYQKQVWKQLQNIPYGAIQSYQDIAIKIWNQKASRAIGMANSKNPIPLIIPCHRVIWKNGKLTWFAHGIEIKQKLLELEKEMK